MIYYDSRSILAILSQWRGSPFLGWPPLRALFVGLFSLVLVTLHVWHILDLSWVNSSTAIKDFLAISNTFIGLLMSFRLNTAFQQWRNGLADISSFTQSCRTIVVSFASYLGRETDVQVVLQQVRDMERLVLIYTSLVFHDCREQDAMNSLISHKWLSANELRELELCDANSNRMRAGVVELWLRRLIQDAIATSSISPIQANTLNIQVTLLPQIHSRVYNTSNIPMPFNYCQYVQVCIYCYLMLYAVVILPDALWYTPIWVSLWGLVLIVADFVALEIECPFGLDPNDIDLELRLNQLEADMRMIVQSQFRASGLDIQLSPKAHGSFRETDPLLVKDVKYYTQ